MREKLKIFLSDNVYLQTIVADTNEQVSISIDKQLSLSGITKRFDKTFILQHLFSNYFSVSSNSLAKKSVLNMLIFCLMLMIKQLIQPFQVFV